MREWTVIEMEYRVNNNGADEKTKQNAPEGHPVEHNIVNAGSESFAFIEVELK